MKKYQCAMLVVMITSLALPGIVVANAQFRMAALAGSEFSERPSVNEISAIFDNSVNLFEGTVVEIITGRVVGFGAKGLVRFTGMPVPGEKDGSGNYGFDWNGELFLSAHLLGGGALVDPFLEVGYGIMGRVIVGSTKSGEWLQGSDGLWKYVWFNDTLEGVTNLSLFPDVAAGVAFDLTGFLVGVRVAFRPVVSSFPGTPIDEYPLSRFSVTLMAGLALGGHANNRYAAGGYR